VRVYVTMENSAVSSEFACEHGLSLYIETGDQKILFDTGASSAFADNAKRMGIDLSAVDFAVLSHGHYDHSGGIHKFFEENDHAPLYADQRAFGAYVSGRGVSVSVNADLISNPRMIRTCDYMQLTDNITLLTCNWEEELHPIESFGLKELRGGKLYPDTFRHEQYLMVEEGNRRIVISGCSHKGICNIVHWLRPDVLIGGFHFSKIETDEVGRDILLDAASELDAYETVYYTGHCTGDAQFDVMREILGEKLHRMRAGLYFQI